MQIEQIVIGKVNFVPYLKENRSLGCQSTKYEIIPTFGYEMFPYVNGWLIDWFLFQIKNIYIISGDNISIVWIADLWIYRTGDYEVCKYRGYQSYESRTDPRTPHLS